MQRHSSRLLGSLRRLYDFIALLFTYWNQERAAIYAPPFAYYSLFALTPLIIICTSLIGLTIGPNMAAQQLHTMILNANMPKYGITAEIIGIIILLIDASGIFRRTQVGLDAIFPIKTKKQKQKFLKFIINQFFSFALVLEAALLILVSLIFSAALSFFSTPIISMFSISIAITCCLVFIILLITITFLLGLLYKILLYIKLSWSEVLFGSMIAAFLFILGKFILGFYLGTKHVDNAFGPAVSLVIILIGLYYSAQILFLGAEVITINKSRLWKLKVKRILINE